MKHPDMFARLVDLLVAGIKDPENLVIDRLTCLQLLFLNHFGEEFAHIVRDVLEIVLSRTFGGFKTKQTTRCVVMLVCAIAWHYSRLILDFWQEQTELTKTSTASSFTQLVLDCLSATEDDHLGAYETKVIACGLSKLYLATENEETGQVVSRIANCLYWLKLREDHAVYFSGATPSHLRQFLLSIYGKATPSVIAGDTLQVTDEPDSYSGLWHGLLAVDEFAVFKKHFATCMGNDKKRIESFLEAHGPMSQRAEVVFRCKRVLLPETQERKE